ncbi:CDGSH iron-sulfur domain-containing protein [Microbulbifer taiwanensis]|uniref:CDGSH iron-sulfur domain-containing protein n=1 Tax=Microbulbifer taiwanensis TaxID=986746 RepID=UPI001D021B56|nr:CDGSH iron-sulfur domain-containing protein [Microbulbifer taiwanensis]
MAGPLVANHPPQRVHLEAGETYFFCVCGRSATQPFCDGSHKVTDLKPLKFTVQESGDFWLCCCKHTHNRPFCDGHHKQFTPADVGREREL